MLATSVALGLATAAIAVALVSLARARALAEETRRLRAQLRTMGERFDHVERSAADAATQAEAAAHLLVAKGLAEPEDVGAPGAGTPPTERGGPGSIH